LSPGLILEFVKEGDPTLIQIPAHFGCNTPASGIAQDFVSDKRALLDVGARQGICRVSMNKR
jgi:hypothetical protein